MHRIARSASLAGLIGLGASGCSGDEKTNSSGKGGAPGAGTGGVAGGIAGSGGGAGGSAGSGAGAGGGGGAAVDPLLRAFCDGVRAAQVEALVRCNGLASEIAEAFVSIDHCAVWGPAVAGGSMLFDAAADREACFSALGAQACDADGLPPACRSVLSGMLAPGVACSFAAEFSGFSECEAGGACVGELIGATGCRGTCVARGGLGDACSGVQPCAAGQTCTVNAGCAPKGSAGTPCGFDSSPECAEGLNCSDLFSGGTCELRRPTGAECGAPGDCEPPNICDRGGNITGTCQIPKQPGDACLLGEYECETGLSYCSDDSRCRRDAKLGERCNTPDGEGAICLVGYCETSMVEPVCEPLPLGEICTFHADCGSGSLCLPGIYPACSPRCY